MPFKVYDEPKSFIHTIIGLIAGATFKSYPEVTLSLVLLFVLYQLYESEPAESKVGDLIEFAVGLAIGYFIIP